MLYWFDTEFHDDGSTIELISIGIVSEDERHYYAESSDYDQAKATPWLMTNVLPRLTGTHFRTREEIRNDIQQFVESSTRPMKESSIPEFWTYCGEYDWIVLRQLFGDLTAWPSAWPKFAMDIAQWLVHLGHPGIPEQSVGLHNALVDACHVRNCWQILHRTQRQGFNEPC